eukprot:TRINITY_DN1258_c0_g1_i2.p1 TRINITY_DN1258_c0_g1~~TRINITY_DN1258_c0_g1_i2.p1  ORF type:complete len:216 (+),score=1.63 TRINITY_DN1258_c0_g1_i2:47-649(+)
MNSPSVFLGDNSGASLPFSFMSHDPMSSFSHMSNRTMHDPSEIEVAQLMVSMSSQKPNHLYGRSPAPFTPPTRTFIYHTPTLSYDGDTAKRGRRTSPKKLVLSPSRCPCPNCGVESSTLWRNCDLQNGSHYLCNACGLRYKKGKYCPLCFQVYYDADTNHLQWEQCQVCLNWTHKNCLRMTKAQDPYVCCRCVKGYVTSF